MNPETTARLLALLTLRRQARADAEVALSAVYGITEGNPWDAVPTASITDVVRRFAALLADLTRWQSQAWALRRIAELLGWDLSGDGDSLVFERIPAGWWLAMRVHHTAKGSPLERVFAAPGQTACSWRTAVPGLEGAGRPEAIAAILLHLEGQK